MKTIIAFFLLTNPLAFASHQIFPVKLEDLTVLDVANTQGQVILEYINWTDNTQNPVVAVIEEQNDFTCEVKEVKHMRSFESPSYPSENIYHILVNWSPGADLSGCVIQIKHPDFKDSLVHLEMNY